MIKSVLKGGITPVPSQAKAKPPLNGFFCTNRFKTRITLLSSLSLYFQGFDFGGAGDTTMLNMQKLSSGLLGMFGGGGGDVTTGGDKQQDDGGFSFSFGAANSPQTAATDSSSAFNLF